MAPLSFILLPSLGPYPYRILAAFIGGRNTDFWSDQCFPCKAALYDRPCRIADTSFLPAALGAGSGDVRQLPGQAPHRQYVPLCKRPLELSGDRALRSQREHMFALSRGTAQGPDPPLSGRLRPASVPPLSQAGALKTSTEVRPRSSSISGAAQTRYFPQWRRSGSGLRGVGIPVPGFAPPATASILRSDSWTRDRILELAASR